MSERPRADEPATAPHVADDHGRFPIVGIGASAGGIQALLNFFSNAPADTGMAFVVILHLSPKHESNADQVLQRATKMPVVQVTESTRIEPDHVYIISPSNELSIDGGNLHVSRQERPQVRPVAIDLFFRSLAEAHRERAVSIVLSGTGSDGSVGIGHIKEHAGITIAQSPEEAQYQEMPQSAIATGQVDFVLPVAEMPQKLIGLERNARAIQMPKGNGNESADDPNGTGMSVDTEKALRDILSMLRTRTGNDFRHYKRATVLRRIERRLQVNGLTTLVEYQRFLQAHLDETNALLKDMLIGVTNFFRDRSAFDAFESEIVGRIFENKTSDDQIRGWVAGCSTGEEVYSLGMILLEYVDHHPNLPSIQLFGSDIDERAIGVARVGAYPESILADVSATRLRQFFTKDHGRYHVIKPLREKVLFATHNVLRDPPFSRLDFISCRNLLIYLDRDAQRHVLQTFHFALQSGGYLFLGNSESAEVADDLFMPIDAKHRVYRAKQGTATLRPPPPALPAMQYGTPFGAVAHDDVTVQRPQFAYASLHQRALERYGAPSLVVDHNYDIVHMAELAGRYLRYVGGEPSHNLVTLVRPELRLQLRTALFQALQGGRPVTAQQVELPMGDMVSRVNMSVRPFRDDQLGSVFMLVVFEEETDVRAEVRRTDDANCNNAVLTQLENELHRTKQQLQSTIEQADVSTEELKASNEELQAINEELRSATEELETSKEELQSVNEELITVNGELQAKVEETAKANDDLQNLIASTGIATIFMDRAMRVKRFTPAAVGLFNLISTDVGRSLLDITHRLNYPELAADAVAAFESLRLIEREVGSADGNWYLARLLPYRTSDDRIDGAVLTLTDVTERRRAEAKLRANEARLQLAAESTSDFAIIVQNMDGTIVTWNKGAERVFGYAESEVIGQPIDMIYLPEDVGYSAIERDEAQRLGRSDDERWYRRKDGAKIYCGGEVTFINDDTFKGYAKIARDLTERKSIEKRQFDQLLSERSMREKTEEANRAKDEFFAVLSHELKNPLNLIHVKAELLSLAPETRDLDLVKDAVSAIQRSVMSRAKIIDDLLDMSRARTGKLTLDHVPTDLAALLQGLVVACRPEASSRDITVTLEGASAPVVVEADPVRVEQIVWNLLSNALKFTPAGGAVKLTLARETEYVRIDVADTGSGIAPDFLPKIFDMFSQASVARSRSTAGLGIGLSLVKQLAEMHGGRIEAHSDGVGRGSLLQFRLPIAPSSALGDGNGPRPTDIVLEGMRVLVVDDSEDMLSAFCKVLQFEGAIVTSEGSAKAAIDAARNGHFDLVLSDIAMPGMDGYQLIKVLRTFPSMADVPAIALTGFGRAHDKTEARAAGYDGHLTKPVAVRALKDEIARVMSHRSGGRSVA
ncbi:chemotaxis protein CheB [Burkholderia sp. IMCC1007]|uniref:chemotaxis protein CheB n=1 Tax=Burkholderia sp. IMCC1007 TaxID=3004104 RepID=UPI0022B5A7CE|nr:chemotaxis protein CheB [Burkholderia sp. IMCC1007]